MITSVKVLSILHLALIRSIIMTIKLSKNQGPRQHVTLRQNININSINDFLTELKHRNLTVSSFLYLYSILFYIYHLIYNRLTIQLIIDN